MEHYAYDSFGGPSLNLRPDELDRLDASQVEPAESPSFRYDSEHYRNLEASINGTINAISKNGGNRRNYNYNVNNYNNFPEERNEPVVISPPPTFFTRPDTKQQQVFTPPPSSQPRFNNLEKVENNPVTGIISGDGGGGGGNTRSFIETLKEERDKALSEMQKLCDQRVELVKRGEQERFQKLKKEYEEQKAKLTQDLEMMLRQVEQVGKVKESVETGLELELSSIKRELKRERSLRNSEREKYQRTIKELDERIRELERELSNLEGYQSNRSRTISFSKDHPSNTFSNYEKRLSEMQRENDSKISSLVRHFEKEKTAALEILKSKIKAEVSLLVPRIKEQCQRVYTERIKQMRDKLATQFRNQYEERLRQMRNETNIEMRLWQRQSREQIERERTEIAQRLREKYEMRIMDVRNECERRILQRLRVHRPNLDYSSCSDDSELSFV